MFKNILCPVDMQPRSKMALKKAITIAHQFNSKIILLNIHEEFMSKKQMVMSRVSVSALGEEFKKIATEAKNEMKNLMKDLEAENVECEYILRDGIPSDIIIKISNEMKVDLIVMGTNGTPRGVMKRVIGSNAERVVRLAHCPVITIKGKNHKNGCENIILPLDLEKQTKEKVTLAIEYARYWNATIRVVSRVPS